MKNHSVIIEKIELLCYLIRENDRVQKILVESIIQGIDKALIYNFRSQLLIRQSLKFISMLHNNILSKVTSSNNHLYIASCGFDKQF